MSITAEALRELHRIHRQLTDLRGRLERGPKQLDAAEAGVRKMEADLTEAKEAAQKARITSDEKQLQLKGREDRIDDLQGKLNSASSNKEYQALKEQIDDPIQTEVFKRIDQDEARHLAMDYWLLDKKGEAQRGQTLEQILEAAQGPATWQDKVRGRIGLYRTFTAFMVGFGSLTARVRKYHDPERERERLDNYVARVKKIPNRAP